MGVIIKFLKVTLAALMAFASIGAVAKRRKKTLAPVQTYYADDVQKIRNSTLCIASDYDGVMIKPFRLFKPFRVEPIMSTVNLYKKYGAHEQLAVWTNNSAKGSRVQNFYKKQRKVCRKYKHGYMQPQFVYCKSKNHKKGKKRNNASERYFVDAYNKTMIALKLDPATTYIIFIDDTRKNVRDARRIAEEYGLNIYAILYENAEQLDQDLTWVYGKQDLSIA